MASVSMSGYLRDPLGEFSDKDKILFKHQTTTGTVLAGSVSVFDVDETGYYDIEVGYGNVQIMSRNRYDSKWYSHGVFTINSDTTADNLPTLLNATTPLSDPEILEVEALLQDAADYATAAEAAQTAAEAAQAATEALFDTGFNSNVATAVGLASTPYPDVNLPMASIMVENLVGDLEYSRDGECYYISISGDIELAESDVPCQTQYGTMFHSAFTNEILYSNDLSQWSDNGAVATTVTESTTLSADGESYMYQLTDTSSSSDSRIYQPITGDGSDGICFSCEIKNVDANETRLSTRDGGATLTTAINIYWDGDDISSITTTGTASVRYEYERLSNGAYYLRCFTTEDVGTISGGGFYIFPAGYQADGSETGSVLVSNVQLTFGDVGILPLVKTNGATASVGETVCTIPCQNNFPVYSSGFSIAFDCKVPDSKAVIYSCLAIDFTLWRFVQDGDVTARVQDGSTTYAASAPYADTLGFSRYVIVFNANDLTMSIYVDGELKDSTTLSAESFEGMSVFSQDDFNIGGPAQSKYANSRIENFKVYHSALSADQVALMGSPE